MDEFYYVVLGWVVLVLTIAAARLVVPWLWKRGQLWLEKRASSPLGQLQREAKRRAELAEELEKSRQELAGEVTVLENFEYAKTRVETLFTAAWRVRDWIKQFKTLREARRSLGLNRHSPMYLWIKNWLSIRWIISNPLMNIGIKSGRPGWSADEALVLARKLQLEEYESGRKPQLEKARTLFKRVLELSDELGVQIDNDLRRLGSALSDNEMYTDAPQVRVELDESKREKLAKLRQEAASLEQEILDEEQQTVSGPHRRAAGIPQNEKSN